MPILVRRIFFYTLLTIFLIIAPLLILYSAGYRYSPTQKKIVKTGAISIEVKPDGSRIIINNEHEYTSPILITNLLPGNYDIQIKKDGYHTWNKTLQVKNGETTFASSVALLINSEPVFIGKSNSLINKIQSEIPKSFKHYSVAYDKNQGRIIVTDTKNNIRIAELEGNKAIWHGDGDTLLFTYSNHAVWQFNPSTLETTLITRLIQNIEQVLLIPERNIILLILNDRIRAIETDRRDRQNSWDIIGFEKIRNATLTNNGVSLKIEGTREGKDGVWEIKL